MSTIILGVLEEGLLYAIMALGVYITYKILDFPDLSVDSTFPMGAAFTVLFIKILPSRFAQAEGGGILSALVRFFSHPLAVLLLVFLMGALAGVLTGIIHVKFKVRDLLSGIIVMTGLYSVNLRIAGAANESMFSQVTIFENNFLDRFLPKFLAPYSTLIILFLLTMSVKILLDLYMKTRSGYLLRAVGDNATLVTSLAKDKGMVKIIGLAIANGLAALAGSVYCQQKEYFEISMGTGAIVIGLANVIIGTKLFRRIGFVKSTTAVIIGSIIYKACVSAAISMGMAPSDLKLITAVLFLLILVLSNNSVKKVKHHAGT